MNIEELNSYLIKMLKKALEEDTIEIQPEEMVEDIEGWDSLAAVRFVRSIEEDLNIKLTLREMMTWETIADLSLCVINKIDHE